MSNVSELTLNTTDSDTSGISDAVHQHKLWIDGAWAESDGGSTITVENPATGAMIAQVTDANRADVDKAV